MSTEKPTFESNDKITRAQAEGVYEEIMATTDMAVLRRENVLADAREALDSDHLSEEQKNSLRKKLDIAEVAKGEEEPAMGSMKAPKTPKPHARKCHKDRDVLCS